VQLGTLALGTPVVVVGVIGDRRLLALGAFLLMVTAVIHAGSTLEMVRRRKRPELDWGLRFAATATVFLLPAAALGLLLATDLLSGPRPALAFAILVLGGWISLTIAGMMLKIVPFLVWYRIYGPRAGREAVPTLAQLSWARGESLAYALLSPGVGLLAAAVLVGDASWIRAAGAILTLGALTFASVLARILGHLRPRLELDAEVPAR
jgi:hypothetical protein